MKFAYMMKQSSTSVLTVSRAAILLLGTFSLYHTLQIFAGLEGALRNETLSAENNYELLIVPSNSRQMIIRGGQQQRQRLEDNGNKTVKDVRRQSKRWNERLASKAEATGRAKAAVSSLSTSFSSESESSLASLSTIVHNNTYPYFILHIGPPKTATTSIQCGLSRFGRGLAHRDNYYYLGNACQLRKVMKMPNGEESILTFEMLKQLNTQNSTYLKALKDRIRVHRTLGHNLILSSEHFISKMDNKERVWQVLKRLTDGFRVKVVIAYRHYFQWIASRYYQQHTRSVYRKWPHLGGQPHPSFQSYLTTRLDEWEASNRTNMGSRDETHHSLWALLLWSNHFDDVHIFDLHQDGDTFTNFVCQTLPSANYTCYELTELVNEEGTDGETVLKRVSRDYHAERVVEEAYQQGLIRKHVSKNSTLRAAREAIGKHSIHRNPDLMECIPQPLEDRLMNASLTFMELLYQADGRQLSGVEWEEAVREHNAMFDQTKAQGKFCDIHPAKFLQNTTLLEDAIHPMHRVVSGGTLGVDTTDGTVVADIQQQLQQ